MSLCELSDPALYYQTLEIPFTATELEIKQSYRRLAFVLLTLCQIHHPDKNNGEEQSKIKFREIIEAYNGKKSFRVVLSDQERREKYDKYGLAGFEEIEMEEWMEEFGTFEQFFSSDFVFSQWKVGNRYGKKSGSKNKRRFKRKEKKILKKQKCKFANENNEMGKLNTMELYMIQKVMQGETVDAELLSKLEEELDDMILESDSESENYKECNSEDTQSLDLNKEEEKMLEFAYENVESCSDQKLLCKIDNMEFQEEDILTHFSEFHEESLRDWEEKQRSSSCLYHHESKEYEDFDY